jgi:hypothetical protein
MLATTPRPTAVAGGGKNASDGSARAQHLAAEEQWQAAAHEQQRNAARSDRCRVRVPVRCERRRGGAVPHRHDIDESRETQLSHPDDPEHDHRRTTASHDCGGDPDRKHHLEGGAVAADARADYGKHVIDDVRRRVDQVQRVAEDPQRRLHSRDRPSGGGLDEGVEATGPGDVARVAEPDDQRDGEQQRRGQGDQSRRGRDVIDSLRRVERGKGERSAERHDNHSGERPCPERPKPRRRGGGGRGSSGGGRC